MKQRGKNNWSPIPERSTLRRKLWQDPQALDSLKCRYYIEVQTVIPGIPNC